VFSCFYCTVLLNKLHVVTAVVAKFWCWKYILLIVKVVIH